MSEKQDTVASFWFVHPEGEPHDFEVETPKQQFTPEDVARSACAANAGYGEVPVRNSWFQYASSVTIIVRAPNFGQWIGERWTCVATFVGGPDPVTLTPAVPVDSPTPTTQA